MSQPQHLSADLIADLLEGSLPAAEAMHANAHLAGCADCADLRESVLNVSVLLAEEGAASWEMPADVADSLDEALATASLERAAGAIRLDRAHRRRDRGPLSWLTGAAAAIVVAGVGIAGWQAVSHHGTNTTDATSGQRPTPNTAGKSAFDTNPEPSRSPNTPNINNGGGGDLINPVSASQVPQAARHMLRYPKTRVSPAHQTCKTPVGGVSTVVTWHGAISVLNVNPDTHTATIFDCLTSNQLFSTRY